MALYKPPPPVPKPAKESFCLNEEQLKAVLKKYDADGDGKLSRQELQAAYRQLGSRIPYWRAHRALWHADVNGDGYISTEEMKELVQYCKLDYRLR